MKRSNFHDKQNRQRGISIVNTPSLLDTHIDDVLVTEMSPSWCVYLF